jgi:DUF218 domain
VPHFWHEWCDPRSSQIRDISGSVIAADWLCSVLRDLSVGRHEESKRARAINGLPERQVKRITKNIIECALICTALTVCGQSPTDRGAENAPPREYISESKLAKALFPMLYNILEGNKAGAKLAKNADLQRITAEEWNAAKKAEENCGGDPSCVSDAMEFSRARVDDINTVLRHEYGESDELKRFTDIKLVPKAVYSLNQDSTEIDLFFSRLDQELEDINNIIYSYCGGAPERYPQIDGMLYDNSTSDFHAILSSILDGLQLEDTGNAANTESHQDLFFEPSMRFALRILLANMRDEAGRFTDLNNHENRLTLMGIKNTDWKAYHYSAILVPGDGPNIPGISLSAVGRERLRLAADVWNRGKAPYIIVSGGFVHPSRTPYCEAVEMRRYLLEVLSVPENAILIEPYARHTTTNLRNASRLIFGNDMPTDRPMLVVSDNRQIDYIASDELRIRNEKELGYQPAKIGKRVSRTELEATPLKVSLFRDALDPLDP